MSIKAVKQLYREQKYAEALKLCDSMIATSHHSYEAYEKRATIYEELGNIEAASNDIDYVISRMPDNAAPHFKKARWLIKLHRNTEAIHHLSEAADRDNGYFSDAINFLRAAAYIREKQFHLAKQDIELVSEDTVRLMGRMVGFHSIEAMENAIASGLKNTH
jgi:tetratricopeptide (TPR) repeat protein